MLVESRQAESHWRLCWSLIYTVYRYIQLVHLLEHQDLDEEGELESDLTVQLVRLLERQNCDKEGELESLKVESRKALP